MSCNLTCSLAAHCHPLQETQGKGSAFSHFVPYMQLCAENRALQALVLEAARQRGLRSAAQARWRDKKKEQEDPEARAKRQQQTREVEAARPPKRRRPVVADANTPDPGFLAATTSSLQEIHGRYTAISSCSPCSAAAPSSGHCFSPRQLWAERCVLLPAAVKATHQQRLRNTALASRRAKEREKEDCEAREKRRQRERERKAAWRAEQRYRATPTTCKGSAGEPSGRPIAAASESRVAVGGGAGEWELEDTESGTRQPSCSADSCTEARGTAFGHEAAGATAGTGSGSGGSGRSRDPADGQQSQQELAHAASPQSQPQDDALPTELEPSAAATAAATASASDASTGDAPERGSTGAVVEPAGGADAEESTAEEHSERCAQLGARQATCSPLAASDTAPQRSESLRATSSNHPLPASAPHNGRGRPSQSKRRGEEES